MGKVKLGDIAVLINGDRGKNYPSQKEIITSGGIPFVNAGHLNGRAIEFEAMNYITPEKYEKLNSGKFQQNDILYCLRGSLGKKALINDNIYGAIASSLVIIRPNLEKVRPQYLMLALETPLIKEQLFKFNNGSSQPNLSAKSVKEYKLELPDLFIQDSIISKLEKVRNLIEDEKQEKLLLDNLIQARFVEMFGDPATNPYNWDKINISEVVGDKVSNGFFAKRDDYADDGNVSVMGVAYIVNRMYSQWQDLPRTNGTDKDIEKFEVKYGDMLFCRSSLVAEGIGKASIVPEDVPQNTLFECHVIRLPLDLSKCVPEYMQVFSTMEYFRRQIIAQSKTATMTTIGQDGILKADILLPPMSKQREFYAFVHQVNKSKVAVQKALDETQILFDSLMQKYFG